MLEHFLIDLGIIGGSVLADSGSTYIGVKRDGIDGELNLKTDAGMRREGAGKYLAKSSLSELASYGFAGLAFYGLDSLIGIQDSALNVHHAYFYGLSGLKYLTAAGNMFAIFKAENATKIARFPVWAFIKTGQALHIQKFDYDVPDHYQWRNDKK